MDNHKLDTSMQVFFYEQDFYVLSNFSAFRLFWNGLDFDTSEHAYHWTKFHHKSERAEYIRYAIRGARSAHDAFKIAEQNKRYRRQDWNDVKTDIMRNILRAKANQHEYVRRKLLATGDRELIEDSWRDDFWGWGERKDGQNMLGRLWMGVRDEIRAGLGPEMDDKKGPVTQAIEQIAGQSSKTTCALAGTIFTVPAKKSKHPVTATQPCAQEYIGSGCSITPRRIIE